MFNYQIVVGVYYGFVKSLLMILFHGYEQQKKLREIPKLFLGSFPDLFLV